MENSNKFVPPHLNAEVYRTDTTSSVLKRISYLDYIRIHSDCSVLTGCSELTGRIWNGGANIFKNVLEGQKPQNETKMNIHLKTGTSDGCFIENSSKVLLCEDSGAVSVWSSTDDVWKMWTEDISVSEHDDAVLAVDCLSRGTEYVTVGNDGNIKVWDINNMICIRNYQMAHEMGIYGVSVRPKSATSFASASLDQYITLWDDNIEKPVIDLKKNDCGVRCLQWVDENRLLYGDEAGVLRLLDVRNTEKNQTISEFPAAVHRISLNSVSDMVAVCCDNKIVSVCDIGEGNALKIIYQDKNLHSDYVRGVVWDLREKDQLHTVAWDGEMKTHIIEFN